MGHSPASPECPGRASVRLIASDTTWIEGAARAQLDTAARLAGMVAVVGFPDLHPGKGTPVGAAFVSRGCIHPTLIGNDIGCAMSFWATDVSARRLKLDRWVKRLPDLELPWDGDLAAWCEPFGLGPSPSDVGLGTIGGGNHFAELQIVVEVRDEVRFASARLDKDFACLLVHSGSRGLGQAIWREVLAEHGANPLEAGSEAAVRYLARHETARAFARANRALIAKRFGDGIGAEVRCIADIEHNVVTRETWRGGEAWVHRKGAAHAHTDLVVIPGSRGTPSYLVAPTGDLETAAFSLAHGAGRRWQRGYAKSRLSHRYRVSDLERTEYGGRVVCEDRELIYDEAPQAYKDIAGVIGDLEAAGLIAVVAELRPVLTYKVRRRSDD
ncbi:MAG TPA: RNA ligase RtcB family protein [Hyphomicrobiaceae bacterium]|nr:RNA ligase RtcB family protein [Hyphomicrobiaceae bacterium]